MRAQRPGTLRGGRAMLRSAQALSKVSLLVAILEALYGELPARAPRKSPWKK